MEELEIEMYKVLTESNFSEQNAEKAVALVKKLQFAANKELATKAEFIREISALEVRVSEKVRDSKEDMMKQMNTIYQRLILWVIGTGVGAALLRSLLAYFQIGG